MPQLIHANLTEMYAHAVACLVGLIDQISGQTLSVAGFDTARSALEALPLNTQEAATARTRLENARRYSEAGEGGAARYELCLVARSLARIQAAALGDRRFTSRRGGPETGYNG